MSFHNFKLLPFAIIDCVDGHAHRSLPHCTSYSISVAIVDEVTVQTCFKCSIIYSQPQIYIRYFDYFLC